MSWKDNFPKENRYFETENGILYCRDCLEVMKGFPKQSIDLVLADPPYGITASKWDIIIPFEDMWKRLKKIRKVKTPIVLFGGEPFSSYLRISNIKEYRYDWIWDKELTSGFLNVKRMPLRQHEYILVFYKKAGKYNPQMWKGNPLHSKGRAYKNKKMKNHNYGKFNYIDDNRADETLKYPRSIIKFQKPHSSKSLHPTQKPLALMEYLVKTYSREHDLVLDFTCGSGNTLIACEKFNRRWIGIEINSEYCEITKKGLKEILGNKQLF